METESSSAPTNAPPLAAEAPAAVLDALLAQHNACVLASTGGPASPWILGVYFAHEGTDLYVVLEQSGRTLANLRADPRIAVLVSSNDATQDFAQAAGVAEILPGSEEDRVRQRILAKLPWFATYTPIVPVRIRLTEAVVTSLARRWFPGQKLRFET